MTEVFFSRICEFNPPKAKNLQTEMLCSFVPMEHISEISGSITKSLVRQVKEVEKGYTHFRNGDVIFAKITPCMENGKCALASNLKNGIGFGSTEFHIFRASQEVHPQWIYFFLRQEKVRIQAARWFRGTAGQQRVPIDFFEQSKLFMPSPSEQKRIVAILQKADRLHRLRRYSRQLSDGYLQSVFLEMLNKGLDYQTIRFSDVIKIDRKIASDYDQSSLPYIGLEDIESNQGILLRYYSDNPKEMQATNYKFSSKHVLYGKLRPYLNKVFMPNFEGTCSTELLPLLPNERLIKKSYLKSYLMHYRFVDWASKNVEGANLPRLSPDRLSEHQIILPPIEVQNQFDTIFQRFYRYKET